MIDTLLYYRPKATTREVLQPLGLATKTYALCTLHRPSNVDSRDAASNTISAVEALAKRLPVVLPIHPRTRARLSEFGMLEGLERSGRVSVMDPVGYLDFLALMDGARVVFTDSGGIQEDTTVLGVPCLTFRENTERPITIAEGTNRLVGTDASRVPAAIDAVLANGLATHRVPELWDGHAAERIVSILLRAEEGRRGSA